MSPSGQGHLRGGNSLTLPNLLQFPDLVTGLAQLGQEAMVSAGWEQGREEQNGEEEGNGGGRGSRSGGRQG